MPKAGESALFADLGAALCQGLYQCNWGARATDAGIGIKDGIAFVQSDCPRCHSTRYERVDMTTGAVMRTYARPASYRLNVGAGEKRPPKAVLRLESLKMLIAHRKKTVTPIRRSRERRRGAA